MLANSCLKSNDVTQPYMPDVSPRLDQARAFWRANRASEALALCRAVLADHPEEARAHHLLGLVLLQDGQAEAALPSLRRAAATGDTAALAALATALRSLGHIDEAVKAAQAATRARPDNAELRVNLGNALQEARRFDDAIAAYGAALAQSPDLVAAHVNRGLALLRAGRYAEAWPEYEWRWQRPGVPVHYRRFPAWQGEDLDGRTLLLYLEQGFGDALQFVRYLPRVLRRGGTVVMECASPLERLFAANLPGVTVFRHGTPPPDFDLQASLPSLPAIFRSTLDDLPAPVAYLRAPDDGPTLPPLPRPRIGLAWAGSAAHAGNLQRSLSVTDLADIVARPGRAWVSLQVGPRAAEAASLPGITDLSPLIGDFADTAALIEQLDLVVTVDTAVAHLAGALGKPVWILLPWHADWRWLDGREDSPWYPTARLLRQPAPGAWDPVLQRLAQDLATFRAPDRPPA